MSEANATRMQNRSPSPSRLARGPSRITGTERRVRLQTGSPPSKRRRTSPSLGVADSLSPPSSPSTELRQSPSHTTAPSTAKWHRKPSVVWYRGNDLRVEDHPALLAASQRGGPVVPLFIWDPSDGFGLDLGHVKQWWLQESLRCLQSDLKRLGVQLYTRKGNSTEELRKFLSDTGADAVFWNRCYEPDLLTRDEELRDELLSEGLTAESFKAELLVEPWELKNTEVDPRYDTFHAYMRAWMTFAPPPPPFPCPSRLKSVTIHVKSIGIESLGLDIPDSIQEAMSKIWTPGSVQAKAQLDRFLQEVFPAFGDGRCRRHFDGTSRLSPHIRFGELSPRRMYHSTRLHVSRWDQGSMRSLDSSRKPPSARSNGKKQEKKAAMCDAPGVKTEAIREREPSDGAPSPPLANESQAKKEDNVEDKEERSERPPISAQRRFGTHARHIKRPSGTPKRLALPPITQSSRAFLKNLCLRDFSYHVLFHNPDFHVKPLIPEFVNFPWAEDKGSFNAWQTAKTGYPIVDAAMRELRTTGWIHNGMRFLLACFLTKYLLLPWNRGLKEFYGLLVDGDHSSNALGWQWTAGSNTDAFPVSCLVSPVKVAGRHDPTGSYVRQWLPELQNLPTRFIHEPWKAPLGVLQAAGVELGTTYPDRIVLLSEARERAFKAMRLMKQIFSSSSVLKNIYTEKEEDWVKEWPAEESEVVTVDEPTVLSGRMNLIPSLWALLQGDQNSAYLCTSSSGSDPLIAMDTASLTEGALAVPMDDQQDSIEHALITAHSHGPPPEALVIPVEAMTAGDRALGDPIYFHEKNCESQDIAVGSASSNGLPVDHLGEPLKYHDPDVCAFPEGEKASERPAPIETDGARARADVVRAAARPVESAQAVPSSNFRNQAFNPSLPYIHQPPHHVQQFQQLQQLQQFQLQQHMHLQQQQRQRQQPQQQHGGQHQQHSSQHVPQYPHLHHQNPTVAQRQQSHSIMDGIYGQQGSSAGSIPPTSLAGVPMPGAPVMMGPATNSQDLNANGIFTGGDPSNSIYAHHFGLGQFYGIPQVMPLMNSPSTNGSDRNDGIPSSATTNVPKLSVPGMMTMPYGMYTGNMLDQAVLGSTLQAGNIPYGSSQSQVQAGAQSQYRFSTPQVYISPNSANGAPAHGNGQSAHQSASRPPPSKRQREIQPVVHVPNATTAAAVAAVGAGERAIARDVASEANGSTALKKKRLQDEARKAPNHNSDEGIVRQRVDGAKLLNSKSKYTNAKLSHARPRARSSSRTRPAPKRKGSASNGLTKNRNDTKGPSNSRGRGGDGRSPSPQEKGTKERTQLQGTSLKARQEMLASVLVKEDHQFHGFAKYLSTTYELTSSTDRQTSKDYIRLCNLKDDYHKQCKSDKDKLKIYGIKSFFSQVLKLDVTGEWDRHNHGGVRGPYVYGIRARKSSDSSSQVAQN